MAATSIFIVYFVFLLALALPHGLNTAFTWELWWNQRVYHFFPNSTAGDIIKLFRYPSGDQIWFAKAATLLATNSFTDSDYWMVAIFAPGLTFLEFVLLKLFGLECPMVFGLTIITCAGWALVLLNLYKLAKSSEQSYLISFLAPTIVCLSVLFRQYCLQGGVLLTESLSMAFLATSFLYLLCAAINGARSRAVYSGIFLAAAAYLRTQAEMIGSALSLLTVTVILVWLLISFFKERDKQTNEPFRNKRFGEIRLTTTNRQAINTLLIAVLSFNCCTAPYRLWNFYKFHNLSWLQVDYYWKLGWQTQASLAKTDDSWIVKGGISVPAYLNPQLAARIQANLAQHGESAYPDSFYKWHTISTFFRHPVKWIIYKAKLLPRFWFAPLNSHLPVNRPFLIENWIYIIIIIFCLVRMLLLPMLTRALSNRENVFALFYGGVVLASLTTFVFVHFEPRYFYMLKILSTVVFFSYIISDKGKMIQTVNQPP